MTSRPMKPILVLGGTGFVGRAVCELLARRHPQRRVIVPTRRPEHARLLWPLPTVETVVADVHDDTALVPLVARAGAVVQLVAILHGNEAAFDRVHRQLPQRLAAACVAAGVSRVVHVSALGAGPEAPSRYLRSKAAGEAALREAGIELTLLRPSVVFGRHDRLLNLFASMQAVLPVVPLAAAGARFQPVWVEDVAAAIVAALGRPDSIGQSYEAVGPQVLTLAELVRLAGRLTGHPRPVLPLPDPLARVQAALLSLLPGEPLMSADNLDSMKVDSVAGSTLPGLEALGIAPASIEAVAPGYLHPRRGCARLDAWRALR